MWYNLPVIPPQKGTIMRNYPILTLTEKGADFLRGGHVWVFADEVTHITGTPEDGALADVCSPKGKYLGTGFYNSNSKIRVRIISKNANDRFDAAFWERKLRWAIDYRRTVMGERDFACCRLIFGEADAFPGLTVDRFGDVLVTEVLSLGMEKIKNEIYSILVRLLREEFGQTVTVLYERNEAPIRKLEGMETAKGFWSGEGLRTDTDGLTTITENGILYTVDYIEGQKTGFFLDQKYNRLAMQRICKGKKVLDCFTHMGTFALNAGIAGAVDVTGLDISEYAVSQAEANARLNHLENTVHFRQANVLDELPKLAQAGEKYDVVILDPPAFTKSREATKNAIKGYREINMKGLKLVKDGGYLATCSCSHFMTQELLAKTVKEAAKATHKRLRQVEFRTQAPDHPILWAADESYYLKFFIFQVVDEK